MRTIVTTIIGILSVILIFAAFTLLWLKLEIPDVTVLEKCMTTSMYEVKLCKEVDSYVSINNVPKRFINALLISEDASFYEHNGFDLDELQNSIETNIESGKLKRGGSTITQQLAKNVFLGPERSLYRKLKEAIIATKLEGTYSKNFILEKYINVVQFGDGIFGLRAAAEKYFFKAPQDLDYAESAFLVHLLPSPIKYSLNFNRGLISEFNISRIKSIIETMVKYNKVPEDEISIALSDFRDFLSTYSNESIASEENDDLVSDQSSTEIEDIPNPYSETESGDEETLIERTSPTELTAEPEEPIE